MLQTAHVLHSSSRKPYAKHPAVGSFSHKMKNEWLEAEHNSLEDSRCQSQRLNTFIFDQNRQSLNAFTHLIQCHPAYPISSLRWLLYSHHCAHCFRKIILSESEWSKKVFYIDWTILNLLYENLSRFSIILRKFDNLSETWKRNTFVCVALIIISAGKWGVPSPSPPFSYFWVRRSNILYV